VARRAYLIGVLDARRQGRFVEELAEGADATWRASRPLIQIGGAADAR
jgi:hypothetical protein